MWIQQGVIKQAIESSKPKQQFFFFSAEVQTCSFTSHQTYKRKKLSPRKQVPILSFTPAAGNHTGTCSRATGCSRPRWRCAFGTACSAGTSGTGPGGIACQKPARKPSPPGRAASSSQRCVPSPPASIGWFCSLAPAQQFCPPSAWREGNSLTLLKICGRACTDWESCSFHVKLNRKSSGFIHYFFKDNETPASQLIYGSQIFHLQSWFKLAWWKPFSN